MDKQFNFQELHAIVAALRSENGCPWDKAQTHESLKPCVIEEAYEVNQAITDLTNTNNPDNLCEELGDLLLQVMLHSQIGEENGEFTLEDVIDGIARKMIRRHPHVFGKESYRSVEDQQAGWDKIKAAEQERPLSPQEELANIPAAFPALVRSQKVLKKAMKHEMISSDEEEIFRQMLHAVVSLQMAASHPEDTEGLSSQLGTALFSISRLAAKYGIHSEMALIKETEDFIRDHSL